ncbi:uncharacterized protein N7484_001519 [Penicillium longicatenatum]|uniref:uncharacterized protein n=1 Tax=Penicillium longicatenatum TaxID=1561947 RepID=UPI0025498CAB|nr:uncharacterized protein N7484_001519 [Penicillium longicatenatum]KAJ5657870.1 hypothetical protein N7484_001519 [Penicillium longicatenatum]
MGSLGQISMRVKNMAKLLISTSRAGRSGQRRQEQESVHVRSTNTQRGQDRRIKKLYCEWVVEGKKEEEGKEEEKRKALIYLEGSLHSQH